MTDPRADRIATLLRELGRLDPPNVTGARSAVRRAREDLAAVLRRRGAEHVVDAYRYRVERAVDVLREAQRISVHPTG